jgi:hypothetical protein
MINQYDNEQGYCRKLGHHLKFEYCRTEHNGKPCPLIFDCWFERLPVGYFMREHYKPEEVPYITQGKPQKVDTLLDLIQKAKERAEQKNV